MRKFVAATVSAALCMTSMLPGIAAAQEHRFTGFDAPRGATATVNLRIPLGPERRSRPSYGLTLGYGQTVAPGVDGRTSSRAINLADFRFTGEQPRLSQARLAGFDLANLDQDRRLNMVGGGKKSWLWIGLLVLAGLVVCGIAGCFDSEGNEVDTDSPTTAG
jgi:hypothetical protein